MKVLSLILVLLTVQIGVSQNTLAGKWISSDGSELLLNSNGKGSLAGDAFTYKHTASNLTAYNEYGESITYSYKINGTKLTVSGGDFDYPVTFTRSSAGNTSAAVKNGSTDQSIVGKWCWVNVANTSYNNSSSHSRCIVIHANGTYEYSGESAYSGDGGSYTYGANSQQSDNGTWSLNGNTITIVSQRDGKQVLPFQKKNHPKNGDPMIVIDGDAYVTFYQKNPW
jgi:hypothetical protein